MLGSVIAIAGMMGSGKTTLARSLSNYLGWVLLPEELRSRMYLNDLFNNEKRWAFDTQISFLCEKAVRIKGYIQSGQNVILDRSLFEDVNVFALHFYLSKKIDERSYSTYKELSEHFLNEIPNPTFLIYCECSLLEIRKRLSHRQKDYSALYPYGHISGIYDRYQSWIKSFSISPLYRINTEKHDFRKPAIVEKIAEEVMSILTKPKTPPDQLFFPGFYNQGSSSKPYEIIEEVIPVGKTVSAAKFKKRIIRTPSYPMAYIAAPFTSAANPAVRKSSSTGMLFDFDLPHGIIEKGLFRDTLNSISRAMKRMGFSVILPHRDINKWGKRILEADEVFDSCTSAVRASDVFIGLLGFSHGSHYEFGLAMGLNRPSIVISSEDFEESFISKGVRSNRGNLLLLECKRLAQVASAFDSSEVKTFLHNFFPLEELSK